MKNRQLSLFGEFLKKETERLNIDKQSKSIVRYDFSQSYHDFLDTIPMNPISICKIADKLGTQAKNLYKYLSRKGKTRLPNYNFGTDRGSYTISEKDLTIWFNNNYYPVKLVDCSPIPPVTLNDVFLNARQACAKLGIERSFLHKLRGYNKKDKWTVAKFRKAALENRRLCSDQRISYFRISKKGIYFRLVDLELFLNDHYSERDTYED